MAENPNRVRAGGNQRPPRPAKQSPGGSSADLVRDGGGGQGGRGPGPRSSAGRPPAAGRDARGEPRRASSGRGDPGGRERPGEPPTTSYDPRREARRQLAKVALPEDVQADELDREARQELKTLSKDTADLVARHLVMAGRLVDEEPRSALAHARAAKALAGRVGAVREGLGLVAYAAGEWAEALSELRAARRITGEPDHLAVMADCERALGRPDRALLVAEDPQVSRLDPAARIELLIVVSGARGDLGQAEAAVLALQVSALDTPAVRPWTARLRYAYAAALLAADRPQQARQWFARAAEVDPEGETDAADQLLELDGIVLEEDDDSAEDSRGQVAAHRLREVLAGMSVVHDRAAPLPAAQDGALWR
jgi:tetratricopeptide (TPR) repeat protein